MTGNPYITYFLIKVYTPSIMVCIPFYYSLLFCYIYLLTVTEEEKYIVNTVVVGWDRGWDRVRQAIRGCHGQTWLVVYIVAAVFQTGRSVAGPSIPAPPDGLLRIVTLLTYQSVA